MQVGVQAGVRDQGQERHLHSGGVAAGVADAGRLAEARAVALGQAVGPGVVEAVIAGEIDDHGIGLVAVDGLDPGCAQPVGQGEDPAVGVASGDVGGLEALVAQVEIDVEVLSQRLAFERTRGDEGQLEAVVAFEQGDELAAGVAASADDADAFHEFTSCFRGARHASRLAWQGTPRRSKR